MGLDGENQCSSPGFSVENKSMTVEDEYVPVRHSHTIGIMSEKNYKIGLRDGWLSQKTKIVKLREPNKDYYQK